MHLFIESYRAKLVIYFLAVVLNGSRKAPECVGDHVKFP